MNVYIKTKLFEFDTKKEAIEKILSNSNKYNYNSICRCGKKQTVSSLTNWLTKHNKTINTDYVCKDCYQTESFNLFGKNFNTIAEAINYINKNKILKCHICNKVIKSTCMKYWIEKLISNSNAEIICKHCKDYIQIKKYNKSNARKIQQKTLCYLGAYGLIDSMHNKFLKHKNLLKEYTKFEGNYVKLSKQELKIKKQFLKKGIYCDRYLDYIHKHCKIVSKGNHHILPKTVFGEINLFIDCDDYTHSILHYILALDNLEHYNKNNIKMKKVIYGIHARWQFYSKNRMKVFTKALFKRVKILEQ